MFLHDCSLVVKPASTPRRLVHKEAWRDSLPIDMLPFGVTIPATVPQRSEIPERLMNYHVLVRRLVQIYPEDECGVFILNIHVPTPTYL
jgi:hypothetical protein